MGFEGRARARELWQLQTAVERHPKTTLKNILAAVKERQRQNSGRCGEYKGGSEESDSYDEG